MTPPPVLSLITWSPFVGALLIMFTARHHPLAVRLIAAVTTGVSTIASLWIYVAYDREAAGFQFYEKLPLVPPLGISYELGVDGISLLLVLLTSVIIFAGVFASWTIAVRSQEFYALLLTLVTGVFGVFVTLDLFVFFLFYELAVLPMYLLIGVWGSSGEIRPRGIFAWAYRETGVGTKEYAAMKLTLYLLFGSAFILVGIFALYVNAGASSFSFVDLEGVSFAPAVQRWVFLAFYVGFGVLAGIWPLHTWSPDGHASAPTAVSMLHAGVLMKLGAYGVVRMGMGLLPGGAAELAWLMGTIACVNIVYGALSAMAQTDLKYVIAYSSVSHMGIVMLGAATLTETGLNGSVFQMFAHGVMTGLFFALVGLVYEKAHSREIGKMGGFGAVMPGIATAFTVGSLSSLGLPATAGFIAELLTFLGACARRGSCVHPGNRARRPPAARVRRDPRHPRRRAPRDRLDRDVGRAGPRLHELPRAPRATRARWHVRAGWPRDLRQAPFPRRDVHRAARLPRERAARVRPSRWRVSPAHPLVPSRDVRPRLRARPDFVVRRVRAHVDPALCALGLPQAPGGGRRGRAQVLPRRERLVGRAGVRALLRLRRGALHRPRGGPRHAHDRGGQPHGAPAAEHQAAARVLWDRPHRLHARRLRRRLGLWRGDGALLPGHLRLREHGRVPGRGGGGALRGIGGDDGLPWARPALAPPGPRHADLPALARRNPVRRGVLGEALRLLGGGVGRSLLARARRRSPHRPGALLLPGPGQAHVHRGSAAARTCAPVRDPRARRAHLRRRRRRPRGVPEAPGDGSASRRGAPLLEPGAKPPGGQGPGGQGPGGQSAKPPGGGPSRPAPTDTVIL